MLVYREIFKKLRRNQFYKDIATLSSGSVIGQLILLSAIPLLTRIYTPENFGIYAVYVGIASIVSIFTTGRYEFAIALPDSEKEAENVLKLIFGIGSLVAVFYLICIVGYVIIYNVETIHFQYFLENFLFLIPISAFIAAVNTGLSYMVQRRKMYKISSLNTVLQNIGTVTINILIGVFVSIKWGLVLGLIAGQITSIIFLFYSLKFKISIVQYNFKFISKTAKKYINFPKFMLFSDLAAISSQQLTPIVFSFLFNNFIVGNFSLANRFLRLPAIILTSSIASVFRNDALDEIRRIGNCHTIYRYTFKRLFWLSFPIFIILAIFAPFFFKLIFGNNWLIAGEMAQIIAIMMIFDFAALPFNSLFYVYNKQNIFMILQIINTLISMVMLISGKYFFDSAFVSVLLFSISNICFNCTTLIITYWMSKKPMNL